MDSLCATKRLKYIQELSDTSDQSQAGMKENKKSGKTESFIDSTVENLRKTGALPPHQEKLWQPHEYCAQVALFCDWFVEDPTLLVDESLVRIIAKNYPFAIHYMDTLYEDGKCTREQHRFIAGALSRWENKQREAISLEYFKKEIRPLWSYDKNEYPTWKKLRVAMDKGNVKLDSSGEPWVQFKDFKNKCMIYAHSRALSSIGCRTMKKEMQNRGTELVCYRCPNQVSV